MTYKTKQIYMYLAFFIMIAINILANMIPINNYTTGEVSNMHSVFFTPAGYTFSIWSIIYIALFLWLLSFSLKRQELNNTQFWAFLLTCLFNSLWILSWHYLLYGLSVIIIILLLLTLLYLYQTQRRQNHSFMLLTPISLYTGWIMVASLTNILHWLTASLEISPGTQMLLTYLALATVVITGFAIIFLLQDWVMILVFAWSMIGITVQNFLDNFILAAITFVLMVFLTAASILYWNRTKRSAS